MKTSAAVAALAAAGVRLEWVDGQPRIRGAVPMDPDVVLSETPIVRTS